MSPVSRLSGASSCFWKNTVSRCPWSALPLPHGVKRKLHYLFPIARNPSATSWPLFRGRIKQQNAQPCSHHLEHTWHSWGSSSCENTTHNTCQRRHSRGRSQPLTDSGLQVCGQKRSRHSTLGKTSHRLGLIVSTRHNHDPRSFSHMLFVCLVF